MRNNGWKIKNKSDKNWKFNILPLKSKEIMNTQNELSVRFYSAQFFEVINSIRTKIFSHLLRENEDEYHHTETRKQQNIKEKEPTL